MYISEKHEFASALQITLVFLAALLFMHLLAYVLSTYRQDSCPMFVIG